MQSILMNFVYILFLLYRDMPLPPPSCEKPKLPPEHDIHPYVIKLNMELEMMRHVMNNIFDMADSNLVLTDAKSGLNDFSMNYEFADKLDNLSKDIHVMR